MAFCIFCGKELPADAKFCCNCGKSVTEKPVFTSELSKPVVQQTDLVQTVTVNPADNVSVVSNKSRLCALLLGIFVGRLGVHNFYLGKVLPGVFQCVLTVIGFILSRFTASDATFYYFRGLQRFGWPLMTAATIWATVDWILIACGVAKDKNGNRIKKWY